MRSGITDVRREKDPVKPNNTQSFKIESYNLMSHILRKSQSRSGKGELLISSYPHHPLFGYAPEAGKAFGKLGGLLIMMRCCLLYASPFDSPLAFI